VTLDARLNVVDSGVSAVVWSGEASRDVVLFSEGVARIVGTVVRWVCVVCNSAGSLWWYVKPVVWCALGQVSPYTRGGAE
jgi:hypothetical protein